MPFVAFSLELFHDLLSIVHLASCNRTVCFLDSSHFFICKHFVKYRRIDWHGSSEVFYSFLAKYSHIFYISPFQCISCSTLYVVWYDVKTIVIFLYLIDSDIFNWKYTFLAAILSDEQISFPINNHYSFLYAFRCNLGFLQSAQCHPGILHCLNYIYRVIENDLQILHLSFTL